MGVSCTIYKYQDWKHLDIIRSDKSNRPVARVMSDGNIKTAFNKRNVQVIYTPDEANEQAEVSVQFTRLRCQDEGVYKCLLDNGQSQDAKVVATSKKYDHYVMNTCRLSLKLLTIFNLYGIFLLIFFPIIG